MSAISKSAPPGGSGAPGPAADPYVVADHPALDMLNTGGRDYQGQAYDHWQTDPDVLRWLARIDLLPERPAGAASGLAESARDLREIVRTLVERRKVGKPADPSALNHYLKRAASYPALVWGDGGPALVRYRADDHPLHILSPLAEAAAQLLATGDFDLVRQCEHPECVLWFYDRTKSHRRRWCSMAVCGNRHKVAEFRKRKHKGAAP